MLATFVGTNFDKWWPLHYYLGVAYSRTGHEAEAAERFKRVLQLNASHIETMRELCSLYERSGDTENYIKYMKKIALVEENIKADD
jgi:Tetratricopeptide repeat.